MVDRRSFILGGLGPCALQVALPRQSLGSSLSLRQDQTPTKQPAANEWMSQWMLTPQHGEKKLRGAGQGMLVVARFADPMYIVEGPVSWTPDADEKGFPSLNVPKGFVTDLASIPPEFWSILRPDGEYAYAAILHDYMYWTQKWLKEQADSVLKRCMEEFKVPTLKIDAIYTAVNKFGKGAWEQNAKLKAGGESRFLSVYPTAPTTRWVDWKQDRTHFAPNP